MIDVPRTYEPAFHEPPLSWKPVRIPDGRMTALFICPRKHAGLLTEWEIAPDGTVSPSVDCSPNGCDFHDHIRLIGWAEVT